MNHKNATNMNKKNIRRDNTYLGVGIMGVVGLLHFCPLSQLAVISIPMTLTVGDCSATSTSSPSLLCDSWSAVSSYKLNS